MAALAGKNGKGSQQQELPKKQQKVVEGGEFIELNNDDFYSGLVEAAKGIIVDCMAVVKTVMEINSETTDGETREEKTQKLKESLEASARRAPQRLNQLIAMISSFIGKNKDLYSDDPEYMDLFKVLLSSSKSVKEPVLHLVHLATVSFWRTRSAATTLKAQELLETYCKEVAAAIKKVIAAGEELKLMEEEEEEGWIEEEAEELAMVIKNKIILLVRSASTGVKDVTEAANLPKTQEDVFVQRAKEALNCLHELLVFCNSLGVKEEEELRVSFRIFLQTAKQVFQGASNTTQLEGARDSLAKVLRSVVISASAINTEELVRSRLLQEDAKPSGPSPPLTPSLAPKTPQNTPGKLPEHLTDQEVIKFRQLQNHLQQRKQGIKTGVLRKRTTKAEDPSSFDLAKYERQMDKVIAAQRIVRSWVRRHQFRELAINFLIAPESEKLRKRNMALWEIVSTERTYVEQLKDLETVIITPLRSTSHSFISEEEINFLFSNIETIRCLNLQILESMEDRMEKWPEECRFADIFISKAPVLRVYSQYLTNYEQQLNVLTELEKRPAFVAFLKAHTGKMSLANYLILPVQRLPRYEILLQGLLKYTIEEHVDHANIIAALEEIQKLNVHVDKKKKDEDNRKAIKDIKKTITNLGTLSLVVAQRVLMKEGSLDVILPGSKKKERYYIYLFNDILLITDPKVKTKPGAIDTRPRQAKLKEVIRFKTQCSVQPSTEPNAFKLSTEGGKKAYQFIGSSELNRDKWMGEVTKALKEEAWTQMGDFA